MAADSDGSGQDSLTTVVTCEGDLADPEFPAKFERLLDELRLLVCERHRHRLNVRKLEPWNSVRVTLDIPREAALRLRQLANEGSHQLRALGILSVQLEGDQVISLRIATRFGQEPQEIVLRTNTNQDAGGVSSQPSTSDAGGSGVVLGLGRILTGAVGAAAAAAAVGTAPQPTHPLPSTSAATPAEVPTPAPPDKVQFRSPNVVCPPDTQVPKVPAAVATAVAPVVGPPQRNYNGPFPFASMTHAAHAIHSRETQSQQQAGPAPPPPPPPHPFTQPPPPYPTQAATGAGTVKAAALVNPNSPNVAMSSPLLVNLLQNDGAQTQSNKMLPPADRKAVLKTRPDDLDIETATFVPSVTATAAAAVPATATAIKYPYGATSTGPSPTRALGPRLAQTYVQPAQRAATPVRTLLQPGAQVRAIRAPPPPPPRAAFNAQFPRQTFRGQFGAQTVQQAQSQPSHFQQFSSPPPYPRPRLEATVTRPAFQPTVTYQQQPQQQQRVASGPVPAPVASSTWAQGACSVSLASGLQPIAQPMPHLGSLNSVLDNSLSSITPSLTDLSKTDLDSLLPVLEGELDSTPDLPELPDALTSTGKRRQYLINPLTGVLEPMPSDSSSSDSEPDESKDATDIFNDMHSPLNERSNSIYSDDDTCSTTLSRKFDTTDQSDSEATVKSTNSEASVKSHARSKAKGRERARDAPTEKIKLRLKLEKSEPVASAYKVDVSFINTQQPKRATQNMARVSAPSASAYAPNSEELRVPPLHISLRGRNSVVINSEKKKKYAKLATDGAALDAKKSKTKSIDSVKVKKSFSAKELSVKSGGSSSGGSSTGSILSATLSKSDSSLDKGTATSSVLIKTAETTVPGVSMSLDTKLVDSGSTDIKATKGSKGDVDDLPLNYRIREPGEIVASTKVSKPLVTDLRKAKKLSKLNHGDLFREQNLLTGGHLVDEYKPHKKGKSDEKGALKSPHKAVDKLNSHFKKEKVKEKTRLLPALVGDARRGSDSDVAKGMKRHADTNGLSHTEKKRRLSHSETKTNNLQPTVTESQGVNKSVQLKSAVGATAAATTGTTTSVAPDTHLPALHATKNVPQTVVGSTNVGTITSIANKSVLKAAHNAKLSKPVAKLKRVKIGSFVKAKEAPFKTKEVSRDKPYKSVSKLSKQLPLPVGEIDMEAKFKQSLLEEAPRRLLSADRGASSTQKLTVTSDTPPPLADLVVHENAPSEFTARQSAAESVLVDTRPKSTGDGDSTKKEGSSPDRKSTDTELTQTQRLDDKQSGRSPNSGGQGEDSGIESMDALSEKSPNQASQSPHSHTEMTDAGVADMKTVSVKSESKLDCLHDLTDIEEQLAKMDGMPTLNGDLSHIIKTEPFMKTETLIEKLEGKDHNENKEHIKEAIRDECCGGAAGDHKVQTTNTTTDCTRLPPHSDHGTDTETQGTIATTTTTITTTTTTTSTSTNNTTTTTSTGASVSTKSESLDTATDQQSMHGEPSETTTNMETDMKSSEGLLKTESPTKSEAKDLDFDPLPIRRKPPLYTYSNPEKQSRDSDSPIPNLSDLEYDNSDSNSECSEARSKISQKAVTVTRRRKQHLDSLPLNDAELDACLEPSHYLGDLPSFKKTELVKKAPKSLLEQLLIEIPGELPSEKPASSTSPAVSEKSAAAAAKSSIRTRSTSKLNSPDLAGLKTPRHSPKQDSPTSSPGLCPKSSPKTTKGTPLPTKRKRHESESSTQSNVSVDEAAAGARAKKARKCSENAVELIKACMGVDSGAVEGKGSVSNTPKAAAAAATSTVPGKDAKKLEKSGGGGAGAGSKLGVGLLRKSQVTELESSDSDEPLIEVAGKVRNKYVATRTKLHSTKSNIPTPLKPVPVANKSAVGGGGASVDEKMVGTRRSVRNNAAAPAGATLKTRSKLAPIGTATHTATHTPTANDTDAHSRRKTRSAVSDDGKRRRNSRDGK